MLWKKLSGSALDMSITKFYLRQQFERSITYQQQLLIVRNSYFFFNKSDALQDKLTYVGNIISL